MPASSGIMSRDGAPLPDIQTSRCLVKIHEVIELRSEPGEGAPT